MTTVDISPTDFSDPFCERQIALRLWTYVHLEASQFTMDLALDVVKSLLPFQDDQPNALAKRLRRELGLRRVVVKHAWALEGAARLLGHQSWHACRKSNSQHLLQLSYLSDSREESFSSWHELIRCLCAYCDAWQKENSTKIFQLHFGTRFVMIKAYAEVADSDGNRTESMPIAIISPIGGATEWLQDSPAALETLRRHLEESRKAILDGVAVLEFCNRHVPPWAPIIPQPVRPSDAFNSELVLLREDNPLQPGYGYEIARGDEMTCWSQLDLAIERTNAEVELDEDSWRIGNGRYVWQLTTIHPRDFVPGQVNRILNEDEVKRLLRRYKLAKAILSGVLAHHVVIKELDYLNGPADHYRIDLHKLLLQMHKAELSWDEYCAELGQQVEMAPELPIGFVFPLLERLRLKDPNTVFARPTRADLSPVHDDSLLRTLIPRVDYVRYRVPHDLPADTKAVVKSAIADLSASMQLQKITAAGSIRPTSDPLPHLVYAGDGEELRLKLEEHNLVMFAGVMPHLISTEGLVDRHANMWPFALGNSLFLDIDFREGHGHE